MALLRGIAVLAALVLAGCAQPAAAPLSVSSTSMAASRDVGDEASPVAEKGAIQGTVIDDESAPLANVAVTLVELDESAVTGSDGVFEFLNVPVGTVLLAANKPGYASQAIKLEVIAGDAVTHRFQLTPLAGNATFFEVLPRTLLHQTEASLATWTVGYYATALNQTEPTLFCQGCRWLIPTQAKPETMVLEILGQHAVPNPVTGDTEAYYVYGGRNVTTEDTLFGSAENLPVNHVFASSDVGKYREFLTMYFCDFYWVCVNEKRDLWVTLFYGAPAPEGYTAVP